MSLFSRNWEPFQSVTGYLSWHELARQQVPLIDPVSDTLCAMTNLGGNSFSDVTYPLLLVDRFFRFYFDLDSAAFVADVFRWDEETGEITYEVRASVPQADGIDRSPNGVVTVPSADGGFAYKIRSGRKGRSELFGKIPAGEELTVRISDKDISVHRGTETVVTLKSNRLSGFPVGIRVDPDGGLSIGSPLPEGFTPPKNPSYGARRD